MKRLFYFITAALLISMSACADQKIVITFDQLPQPAQAVVNDNFSVDDISYVVKEKGFKVEYEVRFNNGDELDFYKDGSLKKVDCKFDPVPEALVPQEVITYVKATFPNAFITEWGRDDRGYKAELNNGLDLKFDKKYRFLRVDD